MRELFTTDTESDLQEIIEETSEVHEVQNKSQNAFEQVKRLRTMKKYVTL